ncbi:MAG: ribosome recycling factor [Candidatus Lloydbacteria bacterium RIFCSPHIGHO2_01_FULL_49_22]|uniref:Ribosome recycling factor n=1 Tax=Candidatus Lloydbacteria bacterium RIFCSPHIGHO2_01_FULL_49_22 TaxID=1798658 RepID=A0A1G2CUJ0_9BACT|nr:MAG: ribosome recycling factor [Candidatus Lloydbacteria bacterium RIFCSPHIGHO2_01_FULL_49_22]OGZ09621.1 MAG: ribosome recycling factor [Candidatus Lloydbacteria bacterium RIFCSPHIGHO2_02_FULL_50_18]
MAYNFTPFKLRIADIEEWLKKEFSLLRTGRATSAILDSITVDSYGTQSPISHVGTVSMEDARTLRITPWDKSQNKAIEGAIQKANIGLSVMTDDNGLRVIFPELTGERRAQIIKLLKDRLEDARISLRKEREVVIADAKQQEKDGDMSEDDARKTKEELQRLVDDANARFEVLAASKEKDINI